MEAQSAQSRWTSVLALSLTVPVVHENAPFTCKNAPFTCVKVSFTCENVLLECEKVPVYLWEFCLYMRTIRLCILLRSDVLWHVFLLVLENTYCKDVIIMAVEYWNDILHVFNHYNLINLVTCKRIHINTWLFSRNYLICNGECLWPFLATHFTETAETTDSEEMRCQTARRCSRCTKNLNTEQSWDITHTVLCSTKPVKLQIPHQRNTFISRVFC